MRGQVQQLLDSLLDDPSLSTEARGILLDYVYRLAWALDHLNVAGPDAVRGATERLRCHLADIPPEQAAKVEKTASVVLRRVWNLFMEGQQIYLALQGWGDLGGDVLTALPPGDS